MPEAFLPWRDRPAPLRSGMERRVVLLARRLHGACVPRLRRKPGLVFLSFAISGCAVAWLLSLAMQAGRDPRSESSWLAPLRQTLVRDAVALAGIVTFVSLLAMFAIWWERKVSAHIQSRLGPMRVGGWHGWSQSLADGIKLLAKEDLIPSGADRVLFRLAPYLTFVPALAAFIALPFGAHWVFRDTDVGLLLILSFLGIEVVGVLLAGWASNNKWSVYGAMRAAGLLISYEIPMGLSLLVPIMVVGSLQLSAAAEAQRGGWFSWLAFHSPWTLLALLTYFIASLAACKRAPFDLPEAESELVAGFHTEYSGFRWSLFFFAEYAAMFIVSGLTVILFLGAWDAPWAGIEAALGRTLGVDYMKSLSTSTRWFDQLFCGILLSGPLWFVAKALALVYVQMWLRWTLPRVRVDQMLSTCLKCLLPLALLLVVVSAAWELARAQFGAFATAASVIGGALGLLGAAGALWIIRIAWTGARDARPLVGRLGRGQILPGG